MKELNLLYLKHPAFWKWITGQRDSDGSTAIRRADVSMQWSVVVEMRRLLQCLNFSGIEQKDYFFKTEEGTYDILLQ